MNRIVAPRASSARPLSAGGIRSLRSAVRPTRFTPVRAVVEPKEDSKAAEPVEVRNLDNVPLPNRTGRMYILENINKMANETSFTHNRLSFTDIHSPGRRLRGDLLLRGLSRGLCSLEGPRGPQQIRSLQGDRDRRFPCHHGRYPRRPMGQGPLGYRHGRRLYHRCVRGDTYTIFEPGLLSVGCLGGTCMQCPC